MKKFLKVLVLVLLILVLALAGLVLWLTVTEYKPDDVEQLTIEGEAASADKAAVGEELKVLS